MGAGASLLGWQRGTEETLGHRPCLWPGRLPLLSFQGKAGGLPEHKVGEAIEGTPELQTPAVSCRVVGLHVLIGGGGRGVHFSEPGFLGALQTHPSPSWPPPLT